MENQDNNPLSLAEQVRADVQTTIRAIEQFTGRTMDNDARDQLFDAVYAIAEAMPDIQAGYSERNVSIVDIPDLMLIDAKDRLARRNVKKQEPQPQARIDKETDALFDGHVSVHERISKVEASAKEIFARIGTDIGALEVSTLSLNERLTRLEQRVDGEVFGGVPPEDGLNPEDLECPLCVQEGTVHLCANTQGSKRAVPNTEAPAQKDTYTQESVQRMCDVYENKLEVLRCELAHERRKNKGA